MDDNQLYQEVKKGNREALGILFDKYYERLGHFSLQFSIPKEIAEELVSDVFIKFWQKCKENNILHIRAYLYKSVKNSSLNFSKKQVSDKARKEHTLEPVVVQGDQEVSLIFQEELLKVQKIIDMMPKQRRIVFMLNRIDGLKYKEIANILGISPHTVQNHMVKAIKFLHEQCKTQDIIKNTKI